MRKITLQKLSEMYRMESYSALYDRILKEIASGRLKPVKSAPLNGKTPALPVSYWVVEEEKAYAHLKRELAFFVHPQIRPDYYLKHLDVYDKDRLQVLKLSDALKKGFDGEAISENERSTEIWGYEKFLSGAEGKTLLNRCGLKASDLNVYRTAEPIAYAGVTKAVPQNMLILENKDPFYGMRKCLLQGAESLLGVRIGTLIYGKGKGVVKAFEDADISLEDYMLDQRNTLYYFGDLDYEGIGIYHAFKKKHGDRFHIEPFVPAYSAMMQKARGRTLCQTKEGQNRNLEGDFFTYFAEEDVREMKTVLERGDYIPQEMLSVKDY